MRSEVICTELCFFPQVCPHLPWPWMFYSFGALGFVWVALWMALYTEVRGPTEEEFIQPPKVSDPALPILSQLAQLM